MVAVVYSRVNGGNGSAKRAASPFAFLVQGRCCKQIHAVWTEIALQPVREQMIVMRIKGGLGNQMFQYALGRSLSLNTGQPLVLDTRHYKRVREHSYGLEGFKLVDMPMEGLRLPPSPREQPIRNWLWRKMGREPQLQRETEAAFDPAIASITGPAWLEGYFQSERYFEDHAETIRAELSPIAEPDPENARWLAEIEAEPRAVSLHVRRGDYVRNAQFAARHGTCTPDYYARALGEITQRMGAEPILYAFSDDPDWVRDNLKLPAEIRIPGHNDASRNIEDIRLMSACRHHIVANSSFSWWGAWLNPRKDKMVMAPARWFADPAFANPDIWAKGWTKIEG